MTFRDLLLLVRHYGRLSIALVLAGALLGGAFYCYKAFSGGAYMAESALSIAEPTSTIPSSELMPFVGSTATSVAQELTSDDVSVEVEYDLSTRTVEFSSRGATEEGCVDAVNAAANLTAERTLEFFQNLGNSYEKAGSASDVSSEMAVETFALQLDVEDKALAFQTIAASVNEATMATSAFGISGLAKYLLMGLFGGALLAVVAVVLVALRKMPVKSRRDLEAMGLGAFIVEVAKGADAAKLWANTEFTRGEVEGRLCLLPVANADVAALGAALAQCASDRGVRARVIPLDAGEASEAGSKTTFVACPSFTQSPGALYEAHSADGVILCVEQWGDSICAVERTAEELSVAHAKLIGIALMTGRLS